MSDSLHHPKKITIGFSKSKLKFPILAWLIQLVEGTKFSHSYIKWHSSKYDTTLYYHATSNTVNFMSEEAFLKKHQPVQEYTLLVREETFTKVIQFAMKNAGKPYSFMQLFAILFVKLGFPNILNKTQQKSAYICSELVAEILRDVIKVTGKDLDKPLDLMTPKDIQQFLWDNMNFGSKGDR